MTFNVINAGRVFTVSTEVGGEQTTRVHFEEHTAERDDAEPAPSIDGDDE